MPSLAWILALSILVLSGDCMYAGEDDAGKVEPQYAELSDAVRSVLPRLEPEHAGLLNSYVKLRDEYLRLAVLKKTFGSRARKEAQREAVAMDKSLPRERDKFIRAILLARKPYEAAIIKLKKKLLSLEEDMMDEADEVKAERLHGQVYKLREELQELEKLQMAFDGLATSIDKLSKKKVDINTFLDLGKRDYQQAVDTLGYESVFEMYFQVRDIEADIATLKARYGQSGWEAKQERQLQQLNLRLEAQRKAYLAELAKRKAPYLKQKQELEADIGKHEARMQGRSGRSLERSRKMVDDLNGTLKELEDRLDFIVKLEGLVAPEDKKE